MKKLRPLFRCTAALPCIFFLSSPSCVDSKLHERMSEHERSQRELYGEYRNSSFSTQAKPIHWNQAVELTLQNNLSYQNQIHSYQQTMKRRKEQWKSLIPRIFTYLNVDAAIDEIADISSDDITLNLAANLNIPNPVSFYTQLYGIALQELQAKYTLESQRRQLVSRLYVSFLQQQDLEKAEKDLLIQEKLLEKQDPAKALATLRNLDDKKTQIRQRRESLRLSTNNLLNTPGQHWKLVGKLPEISYAKRINNLNLGKSYGQLGLKLQTIQIESILITKLDAEQARLPSLSLGVSTPQLYNSSQEDNFQFNAEDYELFTGLSKSIDVTDVFGKERIRDANFRARISRGQLRLSMESEISRLESTKFTYNKLLQQRDIAQAQLTRLQNSSTRTNAAQVAQDIQRLESLKNTIVSIDRQLTQLDLQLWIWDDIHWQ